MPPHSCSSASSVGAPRPPSQDEGDESRPGARVVLKPLLVVSAGPQDDRLKSCCNKKSGKLPAVLLTNQITELPVVLAGSGPNGADGEEGEGEGG